MLLFRQLELTFDRPDETSSQTSAALIPNPPRGRDPHLEMSARQLLHSLGAGPIAARVRVEWNPRLRTCAGRADYGRCLVTLNPRLHEHGDAEIDRTFRHELAHLLAQFRAGRRRIPPHGAQWRQACCDLGIENEPRCHTLPFPVSRRPRRYLYKCPGCQRDFPRVRRIRRAIACLACCRKHSGGKFDPRFRLHLSASSRSASLAVVCSTESRPTD